MNVTKDTIRMIREAGSIRNVDELRKAFTTATGLVAIDLEPVAKTLFPVITPIRNMIPRKMGKGGTATQWRAVTAINPGGVSNYVEEGKRGGIIDQTAISYIAPYTTLGLENSTSFEAESAGEHFDDIKALATLTLLQSMFVVEENSIVGGNRTLALGQPTFSDGPNDLTAQTDGAIPAGTVVSVYVVPLTHEGYRYSNGNIVGTQPILGIVSNRSNADGTTTSVQGFSGKAQTASVTTASDANAHHAVTAAVTNSLGNVIPGAMAYAWFWGPDLADARLGAITTINSVRILTATGAGTQTPSTTFANDTSANPNGMDGIISLISGAGQQNPAGSASGSLVFYQATGTDGVGTPLHSDGGVGITEINSDLQQFWQNSRLSPEMILVNAQELNNISNKVIQGGGIPLFRFISDSVREKVEAGILTAGAVIGFYLNKYAMDGGVSIPIMLHPNVAPGTILYLSKKLPSTYPVANVAGLAEIETRREYYNIEWPVTTRTWFHGVYVEEVLKLYFPPAFGIRTNIANG